MNKTNNARLTKNARALRNAMTKEERHLWYDFLRNLSVTVNRQKVIGQYIVDFYVASAKLAIELDGSQHYEEAGVRKDAERDAYLKAQGIRVLRYSNLDINKSFAAVCEDILRELARVGIEVRWEDTSSVSLRSTASPQGEALKRSTTQSLPLEGKVAAEG